MLIGIDARFLGSHTGFDRYLEGLLNGLEKNDGNHRYVIFVSTKGDAVYQPRNNNFKKMLIDYPWYGLKEQFLGLKFKSAGVELMHIPHWNVPFFMPMPYVVTIHDLILWQKPNTEGTHLPQWLFYLKYFIFKKIFAWAVNRSRAVMVPSAYTANELMTAFPEAKNKITVTGEAVKDFSRLTDRPSLLAEQHILTPYLLYVGSAYPHKNLKRLIQAFQMVKTAKPGLNLLLVGNQDSFYRDLKEWGKQENYLVGVRFMDAVPDATLGTLYRYAALLVYPSLTEGFGLPPLEALSVGLRPVASRRGSLPEVLGERAVYCNPEDTKDIASKIESALELPRLEAWRPEQDFASITRSLYENLIKLK